MAVTIIKHEGIISSFEGDVAKVRLLNISACSSCHVKSVCSLSEADQKIVDVAVAIGNLSEGDKVNVLFDESLGLKALFLGYILPFMIMMVVFLAVWALSGNEAYSGLAGLVILAPYYLLLAYYRKPLQQSFAFKLEKRNSSI